MKKLFFSFVFLFSSVILLAQVTRIDPPTWWIGFQNPNLQLMVYGKNITLLTPEITYEGVTIQSVTRAQSPNYLFVDLKIENSARPGQFNIQFKKDGVLVSSYAYTLNERPADSASRESFSNSDVIYLLVPDRFANGNPANDNSPDLTDTLNRADPFGRHGGDIKGILDHLSYLEDLGITTVWTTPLLEDNQPRGSYHHYAVSDFYKIDARFGTNEEYRKMVTDCHKHGIKVIMDVIPNHCGSAHPWMKDLPFDDWTHGGTTYTQTNYCINTTNDPYVSKRDAHLNFNGWFVDEMPDLNQNNPFLLTYLKQFAIWWLEYTGLDGIRVDTYVYNDPDKIAEWTKAILSEYPNLNIVGECWQHSAAEVAYWQSGTLNYDGYDSGLPSVMDFALHDAAANAFNKEGGDWNSGLGLLWKTLSQDYFYAHPYNLIILLENHDTQRFITQVGNRVDKYKLAMTFLLTTRGIPQLYYGSEILMGGDKRNGDGDIRRDMPGGWNGDERSVFTPTGRTSRENDAFNYIQALIKWRNKNPVLQTGELLHFIPQNGVYTYFRMNEEKTVMVILNNNSEQQTLDVKRFDEVLAPFSSGIDIIQNKTIPLHADINIEGNSAMVIELINNKNTIE